MDHTASITNEFVTVVDAETLERTAAALRERGLEAQIAESGAAARSAVTDLIPATAGVLTAASQTLQEIGLSEEINESGRFNSLRRELAKLDFQTQRDQMRRLGGTPDYVVGSVQAITEDGIVVCASATGSQLAPYAYGAGRVIWVVGAQKIVPDLPAAFRRIREHCYPLEDARAQRAYGQPSSVSKALVIEAERVPGRTTVLLIPEVLGF
jgi:acyl-CoA hydrolase